MILSAGLATMTEMSTSLGTQDLYDLLEVIAVDNHNRDLARRYEETR